MKYGDKDTEKSQDSFSDTTSSSNGQGGTTTWTDSLNETDKATDGDNGELKETGSSTTDDGSGTDTDHGTLTYSNTTTVASPILTSTSGYTNGDINRHQRRLRQRQIRRHGHRPDGYGHLRRRGPAQRHDHQ